MVLGTWTPCSLLMQLWASLCNLWFCPFCAVQVCVCVRWAVVRSALCWCAAPLFRDTRCIIDLGEAPQREKQQEQRNQPMAQAPFAPRRARARGSPHAWSREAHPHGGDKASPTQFQLSSLLLSRHAFRMLRVQCRWCLRVLCQWFAACYSYSRV